jgi:hypothetical protein
MTELLPFKLLPNNDLQINPQFMLQPSRELLMAKHINHPELPKTGLEGINSFMKH